MAEPVEADLFPAAEPADADRSTGLMPSQICMFPPASRPGQIADNTICLRTLRASRVRFTPWGTWLRTGVWDRRGLLHDRSAGGRAIPDARSRAFHRGVISPARTERA